MLITLHVSPRIKMPTSTAVSGSNAPRMATMVLSMRRRDMVTQMLLRAVGITPSSMMLVQHLASGTVSIIPSFRVAYVASISMPTKNT